MHEYSIVQSLLGLCEDNAREHNAKKIEKVTIKIGKYSGVEPQLLKTAFDTFKNEGICKDSKLEMIIQDLVINCRDCGAQSTILDQNLYCHECKSIKVDIIDGKEMYLMSLDMVS